MVRALGAGDRPRLDRRSGNVRSLLDADCLLRGKTTERYQAYSSARTAGWISANEIRGKEGLNPVEGGDEYSNPAVTPGGDGAGAGGDGEEEEGDETPPGKKTAPPPPKKNAVPPKKDKKDKKDKKKGDEESEQANAAPQWLKVMAKDAGGRIANAEARELLKRAGHACDDPKRFEAWCADFYENHRKYVKQVVAPIVEAAGLSGYPAELVAGAISEGYCSVGTEPTPSGNRADVKFTAPLAEQLILSSLATGNLAC